MTAIRRVCVCWPHLVPYHDARLRVLRPYLAERGAEVTALETAAPALSAERSYPHATVFPGRSFEAIPGPEMERGITTALDRLDPDAVAITSYSTPDSRAALAWCRRHRRVAVMMFDSRREDAERSAWREWVKRRLVELFDAALVGGTPHVRYAVELGIPRSHIFTPVDVVDNRFFADGAAEVRRDGGPIPGLGVEGPFFLSVSRLTEVKNLPLLLDAYARYRRGAQAAWPLVVVGNGPERQALEHAAGGGVVFAGTQPTDALLEYYGRAGALVLPSVKDTWGLVVNEAMASGLPVLVSTGAGCAPDLVEEPLNGFTFSPDDPAALAVRLGNLAGASAETREALGARSREIIGRFGLDDFAEGLWAAIQAGRTRADRGASPAGTAVLRLLRALARDPSSFTAIPD